MDNISAYDSRIARCIALPLSHIFLLYQGKGGRLILLRSGVVTVVYLRDIRGGSLLLMAKIRGVWRCVGGVAVTATPSHSPPLILMQIFGNGHSVMIGILRYGMLCGLEV